MSDKPYSISKAFNESSNGALTGLERETNFTALRAFERMEVTDKRVTSGLTGELIVPWEAFIGQRQLAATGSPLIGTWTTGYSDLQTWSMVLKSGATVLRNLKANAVVWEIGQLPTPSWLAEFGQALPTSPVFGGVTTKPWRISGMINVSSQLLKQQASPDLDRILVSDLSRELGSFLDQACLYGSGSANYQPQGLVGLAGVQAITIDPANLHPSFCMAEKLIADQNVNMDSYAVLCSTDAKRILNSTAAFAGGGDSVWEKLRNPQSSPEITDNRCFVGCWQLATICLYGPGIEFILDPITLMVSNQIKVQVTMLADVAFRFANACGVTETVTTSATLEYDPERRHGKRT